ncbi:MAG: OmpA family protein [Myxococcota bacterium]
MAGSAGRPAAARAPGVRPAADRDGDGVTDLHDACPDDPEDLDGAADFDGCPEPEVVLEITVDEAPPVVRTMVGEQAGGAVLRVERVPGPCTVGVDAPGFAPVRREVALGPGGLRLHLTLAPVPGARVAVDRQQLALAEPVRFDGAALAPSAPALLDEVAAALELEPRLARILVRVHADDAALASARAEAVRAYLVDAGVGEERLLTEAGAGAPAVALLVETWDPPA